MPQLEPSEVERLLCFNTRLLDQALALVAAHEAPARPAFADLAGAHLRHVIEHYEALVLPGRAGVVDYDSRPRDRELERDTALANARLRSLHRRLAGLTATTLEAPVRVFGRAGLAGEFAFAVVSSIGRELVFVASHTVHHFALLQAYCQRHGIPTDPDFGKAPATVAYERTAPPITAPPSTKDPSCPATLTSN
jgi:hypothetical protein